MATPILEIQNLSKVYGKLRAVDRLNLTLEAGDIMGFVGPNGAGKTTTIKMVSALLDPTFGTAKVAGIDVSEDPAGVRKALGYMPDFFGVYDDLKVWEYLDFFAAAYNIPKAERKQAADDVLELTDLAVKRDSYVESLSRGMKQRLCLAKTLLHDPQLLILDEPASGLDPRARIEVKEILKDLRRMGKTILVSSHILPELADFCNKVAVIEAGRLIVAGAVEDIVAGAQTAREFTIKLKDRLEEAKDIMLATEHVIKAEIEDGMLVVDYAGSVGEEYVLVEKLVKQDFQVLTFMPAKVNLEDVFLKVTKGIVQ